MELDKLDRRIIDLMQNSEMLAPKLSSIARAVGSTNATVYRRIEAMRKEGIIVGHTTRVDSKLVGANVQALVYIRLKGISKEERTDISRKIANMKSVYGLLVPVGKWSYMVMTRQKGIDELNTFIDEDLSRFPIEEMHVEIISKVLKE